MAAGTSTTTAEQRLAVVARQHDTVDLLCWRHFGRTAGTTEATLAANRGLAATTRLQAGQLVTLVAPPRRPLDLVQLWT